MLDSSTRRGGTAPSGSDPHAEREASRYEQPIASREMILRVLGDGPLSAEALVMLVLFVVFAYVAKYTAYGRSVYATGGNAAAARLAGINVARVRVLLFATTGLLSAITGVLLAARLALRIPARAVRAYRKTWPVAATGEIFGQVATDFILRSPATRVAAAKPSPTFVYEFAWQSPARDLRAAHALELGFVFDTLTDAESQRLSGPDAPASLAAEMNADWVRFIATGDPGWPAFDERRLTRVYDTRIIDAPQRRQEPLDLLPISR